jgi:hypothetical protein
VGGGLGGRRGLACRAVLTAAVLLLAPACGGDDDPPAPLASADSDAARADATSAPTPSASATAAAQQMSTTGTARSPIAWRTERTGDAQRDAVLAAYQAYYALTVRLSEEPDPRDPLIDELTAEPQRSRLRDAVESSRRSGYSRRGPVIADATVRTLAGGRATVQACADTYGQRTFGRDERELPGSRGRPTGYVVTLHGDGGTWKVVEVRLDEASRCG